MKRLAWLLLLLITLSSPRAVTAEVRFGGSLKSLDLYLEAPPAESAGYGALSGNRLRLELAGPWRHGLDVEFALDNQLLITDPPGYLPLPVAGDNRRLDLDRSWNDGGRWADRLQIDRASVGGNLAGFNWRAGRQALGFGRIAMVSPLDVIAPFPPDAIDTDVRPGVDALHLVRYFGLGGQIGTTLILGDSNRHNSYLLTLSENVASLDLLAISGSLRHRPLLGVGLAGNLGPLGLKGEATGYRGTQTDRPGGDPARHFAIAALEVWYRFDAGPVLLAEYLYNGAGSSHPGDYPTVWSSAPFREGLSFLAGRHYLLLGPSWEVHPLVRLDALTIANLDDGSCLLRPRVEISLSDAATLQLFWSFSRGRAPRSTAPPLPPSPRSEFGSGGDSGGLFLTYFF